MNEIYRVKFGTKEQVVGYEIKQTTEGEVFDFITETYNKKTKLSKDYVLSDIVVSRRAMPDVLSYIGATKEEFIDLLNRHKDDVAVLEDVFFSTNGCEISISLPSRISKKEWSDFDRKFYDDSRNDVNVFISGIDYSNMFDGFEYHDEKTVNETFKIIDKALDSVNLNGGVFDQNKLHCNICDELTDFINNFDFNCEQ